MRKQDNLTRSVDGHALGRFDDGEGAFTGLLVGSRVARLVDDGLVPGPATPTALLERWSDVAPRLEQWAQGVGPSDGISLADLRVLAPVEPRQILAAGANYRTHVAQMMLGDRAADDIRTDEELRQDAERFMDERVRVGTPFFFLGLPSAVCGPYDDVLLPPESSQVDWEAELAVVIGRPAHRVSRDQAMDHVAGYTVCNDVSARDLQHSAANGPVLGIDWLRAKNRPTFLPTGPFLVPAYLVPDYRALRITFHLNGERKQDDVAANLLFDVPSLVAAASSAAMLLPGDLVLTGSPAGNGGHWQRWLRPGDLMEAGVSGLGSQRNRCVREPV